MVTPEKVEKQPQSVEEILDDLRRKNIQTAYRQHMESCRECRTYSSLCTIGWALSRQLIGS